MKERGTKESCGWNLISYQNLISCKFLSFYLIYLAVGILTGQCRFTHCFKSSTKPPLEKNTHQKTRASCSTESCWPWTRLISFSTMFLACSALDNGPLVSPMLQHWHLNQVRLVLSQRWFLLHHLLPHTHSTNLKKTLNSSVGFFKRRNHLEASFKNPNKKYILYY